MLDSLLHHHRTEMTVPDSTPAEVAPDWGEDVIYSEAVCHVDDVYYEGSEDDEYPDPAARKLRIEAAGRRYLEGHVPFLLSASLRGPFDKESGWVNPWRSRKRAMAPKPASPILAWKGAPPPILNEPITQAQRGLISDSLECHLPSPESLKQATVTAPHQYLEEDELAIVQSWRQSIYVPSLSQGSFWASTKAQLTASAKKRRAKESEWLKKVASKKRKTDSSEPSFSKSPLVQRNPNPVVSTDRFGTSVHASPMRNPGRSFESSQRSKSRVQWHGIEDDEDYQIEQDELMDSTPDASFGSAHGPLASTPKRISPRRDMWKSAVFHTVVSEDELSQNEAAAATLSSPVSQRRQGRPTCTPNANVAKQDPTASVGTQTSPPNRKQTKKRGEVQHMIDLTDRDEQHDEAMQNGDGSTATPDFETQQDQSFCFRMRHKSGTDPEKETPGEVMPDESNQREEVVSPKVAGPPNPTSAEPTPSPDVVGNTTMQEVREDDVDVHSIEEAEHSETTEKPGLQFTVQQLADQMVQARPRYDHNAGSQDSTGRNASKNTDQQANSPLSPVQLVEEDSQAAAPPETGIETSSTSPMDVFRESDNDPALENDCQWDVDHAAAQEDAVPAPEAGHTVPAGAETELQQDDHANCSPGPVVSGNDCVTAQVVETAESGAAPGSLDESVRPVDDDVPMDESADTDPNEFSFKGILHRLVPSSPWTRLSQLATRTASSPAPAAKVEGAADEDLVDTCCDFDALDDANELDSASSCSQQSLVNELNDSSTAGVMDRVIPSQPNLKTDPVTAATKPRLDSAPDGVVFKDAIETNKAAYLQEARENIRIAESQQSPWTKTQLSQQVALLASDAPIAIIQVSPSNDTLPGDESQPAILPAAQSPWSGGAHIVVDAGTESATAPHKAGCNAEEDGRARDSQASRSEPRPSTPEPRFAFKSFASFMSPSPERTHRQTGRTRSQGSLPSAIKDPSSDPRTNRRVSWALMPPDQEIETQAQNLEGRKSRTPTARSMSRQGSPPPATPIGELPTSEDAKFNKHFAAVASRTDGLRQKLIPTASQQVAQSPGLHGMAETFLAADVAVNDTGATDNGEQVEQADTANPESQEPMDVVEDMFREMGDFLQVWDVDAELNQARKATNMGAQQVGIASQSPW